MSGEPKISAQQVLEMALRQAESERGAVPDDFVVSVGTWRDHPIFGAPHRDFDARIRVTAGQIRSGEYGEGAGDAD